jgi:hypothetical protein
MHPTPLSARLRALLLALAASALPAAAQEQRDTVTLADGKVVNGSIQSEDYGGVAIKVGPKVESYPWAQVRAVEYRDAGDLAQAREDAAAGRLDEAEAALGQVVEEAKARPVLRQQALYELALLQERKDDAAAASAAWHRLVEEFPAGRHLGTAAEALVGARVTAGDFAGAGKELAALAPRAEALPEFKPRLALLEAGILEAQGKVPEAQARYAAVEASAGGDAAVKTEAQLGQARALVAQKKPGDAQALLRRLVTQEAPGRVLAEAWNTLADLLLEQGRSARDADGLLEALFAYLRSSVLYGPLPGEPTREHERALAGSARCFQSIAELEKNEERKQLYQQRARERADVLARDYPDSEFRSKP